MKRAIVIGASSGIGKEVAKLLLQEGWTLGVAARRVELLQTIGAAEMAQLDVTADDATERLRDLIVRLGGMDLFFYASGIGKQNRELKEDIELATVTTNGLGFTRMIGEAYRYFAERGEGHIAAITSIAGTKGLGPAPSYSATKAMQNVYLQALEQQANARGLKIRFTDIGHLLGSAAIEVWLTENGVTKKIVFSGDIGNDNLPLIRDFQTIDEADYVLCESTYGDRMHVKDRVDYVTELAQIIRDTFAKGGNVVIPSFAVGRTQELLYFIRKIKQDNMLPEYDGFDVYVDSPLAVEATNIFNRNVEI